MKKIQMLALSVMFAAAFAGCGETEYDEGAQRTRFESYLTSLGVDYVEQSGVYKYTYYTEGNPPVLDIGDSAYIYYTGYRFTTTLSTMYTTNIESDALRNEFDTGAMDFGSKGIKIGNGSVISGLERGLQGCMEGDSLMLFLSYDLAYGDKNLGVIPAGSAVAFKVVVDKIIK